MQDLPDQPTQSIGNRPNRLRVPLTRNHPPIHELEDAPLGLDRRVGRLMEEAPHLAVAVGGAVAVVDACTLLCASARAHPERELLRGRKRPGSGPNFGDDLLAELTPSPGTSASRSTAL